MNFKMLLIEQDFFCNLSKNFYFFDEYIKNVMAFTTF